MGTDMLMSTIVGFHLVLLLLLAVQPVNMKSWSNCDGVQSNSRMLSDIVASPSVYTALQCEDKCFRAHFCDAFNFKQRAMNQKYSICELVKLNTTETLSTENGFMFKKINRTSTKEKWAS